MQRTLGVVRRYPPLRFLARAVTLTVIAYPLVNLADTIESTITHTSEPAAVVIVAAFGLVLATTLMVVQLIFRTVP
jgi:hypothetical protein